jgi:hypothetical protein
MLNTSITPEEQLALAASIAAVDGATAAQRGTLKGLQGAAMLLESQNISTSDALEALARGATRTGDQILLKVLSVLIRYLTPWGVLLLLSFGLYQAVQTAKASATGFMALVKRVLGFVAPLQAIRKTVGKIFEDGEMEADPATGLAGIATLVASTVPLFGIMVNSLASAPPTKDETSVYHRARTLTPQLGRGGYDIAYDGELDIAYDNEGDELDMDSLVAGDIVFDVKGNRYEVDAEGDLVPT